MINPLMELIYNDRGNWMEHHENSFNEIASRLQDLLKGLQYGSITIVVQDGKIVQLEKSEKVRVK